MINMLCAAIELLIISPQVSGKLWPPF